MKYKVHSFHSTTVDVPAVGPGGIKLVGVMPAVIAELVPANGGPTITHIEYTPTEADAAAAAKLFAVDNVLMQGAWTLAK